ncbi:MAG: RloB domain-containing protein [Bacteroidaceae bacterium]|nr:RloB domain-containing protein [Bacteroidaceae bacterium]
MEYSKGDAFKEAGEAKETRPSATEEAKPSIAPQAGYSKGEGVVQPKAFVVIFSGGNVREPGYFKLVTVNPSLFPMLKIKVLPEDRYYAHHEPRVFTYAEMETKAYRESASDEHPDDYYVVTDVDVFMSHIIAFKPRLESQGIKMMVSNPCFEVWLYYSRRSDKFEGFVTPANPEALSSAVKTFVHLQTGGVNPTKALYDIDTSIKNARATYAEDANAIPALFSTSMYVLAERIKPLLQDGLAVLRKQDEERIAFYKAASKKKD